MTALAKSSSPTRTQEDDEPIRQAIGDLLDGQAPPDDLPQQLGDFDELYSEMMRAYAQGGTTAVRKVFAVYARFDSGIAALRGADPLPASGIWTTRELMSTRFADSIWTVPELLPCGLVIFAGRPKLGKSWLALQIATAVGAGQPILGRQPDPGRVLYLALEDNPQRIQERLRTQNATPDAQIDFLFQWQSSAKAGIDAIYRERQRADYSLIIIDTLSRLLEGQNTADGSQTDSGLSKLQRLAIEHRFTILAIDHHRKTMSGDNNVIDDVMGATFKVGVIDAAWGLYRKRGDGGATLKITGRDVVEQELALAWQADTCSWQLDTELKADGSGMEA